MFWLKLINDLKVVKKERLIRKLAVKTSKFINDF